MGDENRLETPKACSNDVIRCTKKFLAENPRLVELQGLTERTLKNPDMLLLYFESARATGGGDVEKFFVNPEKKTALLLFKEERAARRVVQEQYFWIEDSIVTAVPPSPHVWNFMETAAHLVDCKISPGKPEQQALQDALKNFFQSDSYNGSSVSVSRVLLNQAKSEVFVWFGNYIDALLVLDKFKGKEIKVNDVNMGRLAGLAGPPEESEEPNEEPSEDQDENSVIVKKSEVMMPLNQIQNLVLELGLDVDVKKQNKTFKLTSSDPAMIFKLMEAIKAKNEAAQGGPSSETSSTGLGQPVDGAKPENEAIQIEKSSVQPEQVDGLRDLLNKAKMNVTITEQGNFYILSGSDCQKLKYVIDEWKAHSVGSGQGVDGPDEAEDGTDSEESDSSDSDEIGSTESGGSHLQTGIVSTDAAVEVEVESEPNKKKKRKRKKAKTPAAAAQPPEDQKSKEKKGKKGRKSGEPKQDKQLTAPGDQPVASGNGEPGNKKASKEKVPTLWISKNKLSQGTTLGTLQIHARELGLDVKISEKGKAFQVTGNAQPDVSRFYNSVVTKPEAKEAPPLKKQEKKQSEAAPCRRGTAKLISTFRVPKNELASPWTLAQLQHVVKSLGMEVIVAEGPQQFFFTGENTDDLRNLFDKIKVKTPE